MFFVLLQLGITVNYIILVLSKVLIDLADASWTVQVGQKHNSKDILKIKYITSEVLIFWLNLYSKNTEELQQGMASEGLKSFDMPHKVLPQFKNVNPF